MRAGVGWLGCGEQVGDAERAGLGDGQGGLPVRLERTVVDHRPSRAALGAVPGVTSPATTIPSSQLTYGCPPHPLLGVDVTARPYDAQTASQSSDWRLAP